MSDSEDGQGGIPLIEQLSETPEPATKRKRNGDGEAETQSKRAAKRKKTKKPKDIQDEALDTEAGLNHAIAHMEGTLMADHIAQRTKRFQPDLSAVELGDCYVPGMALDARFHRIAADFLPRESNRRYNSLRRDSCY